jgi:hypothetical protein
MRTVDEIQLAIENTFEERTNQMIHPGSVVDLYNHAVATEMENAYQEIENNKNPHLYSKLAGDDLTDMGKMCDIIRRTDESDTNMLYRLHNWTLSNAKANTTAITTALLNMTYASDATYVPQVYGCGTGVVYIIPKDYSNETIALALAEAKERIEDVVSKALYVQYIVPRTIPVRFQIALNVSDDVDVTTIRAYLALQIKNYVNALAPKSYMEIGAIEKLCLAQSGVTYFRILSYTIDEETMLATKVLQATETKLMFDDIVWTEAD